VTLSIGGAVTVPTRENGLLDLVAIADRNMYEAKAKGRNKSIVSRRGGRRGRHLVVLGLVNVEGRVPV